MEVLSFSRGFNQTSENNKLNKDDSFMKSYLSGGRDGVVFFTLYLGRGRGCTLRETRKILFVLGRPVIICFTNTQNCSGAEAQCCSFLLLSGKISFTGWDG